MWLGLEISWKHIVMLVPIVSMLVGLTVKGKSALSLERQVRIAAGALVLLGVLLGAFVHTGSCALPASDGK